MAASRSAFYGLVIAALIAAIAVLAGCAQGDVSGLKKDLESIKSELASLKTEVEKGNAAVEALKSEIDVLQVLDVNDRGFDANDPNHAKDAPGRITSFTFQRVSKGGIQMDILTRRMPANTTLYVFVNVIPEGKPGEFVRAGEMKTDANGRGTLKVAIPRPPGVYEIAGISSNVDKSDGPYIGRIYTCMPKVRVRVEA